MEARNNGKNRRAVARGQRRMEQHRQRTASGQRRAQAEKRARRKENPKTMKYLAVLLVLVLIGVGIYFGMRSHENRLAAEAAAQQAAQQAALDAQQAAAAAAAEAEAEREDEAGAESVRRKDDQSNDAFADTLAMYGSPYDVSNTGKEINLQLACKEIDGLVLNPGDVFSFNDVVGERTADKGYQEASAYVSGNIQQELGGGICQVASTIYYCVLYSCLEVVERSPHQYIVSYVPGGMDATVYWGYEDFKFRNNTDHPIRIDAETRDGICWVALRGTNTTHNITVMSTELVSFNEFSTIERQTVGEDVEGVNGYTYRITRRIYNPDGQLISEENPDDLGVLGYSVYSKRDAIVYTGKPNTTSYYYR